MQKTNDHRLSTKCGMKHGLSVLIKPHSRATLTAVRILSPVHIMLRMPAWPNSLIVSEVFGFSLFSKTISPINSKLLSASVRVIFWTFIQLSLSSYLAAQAMTR